MQNERKVVELNLSDVLPNRFQPRIKFDENAINELALSIQKYGVIQPIVVRQIGNKYEIIAGERRYKASKVAGKQTIPAIISELNDKDSVEIALIENVQREDLTPIEKAVSYKKILDMGYINQEDLAKKVGKSQSAIANTLRLLNLSDDVQEALLENKISERHARSLLKIKDEKKQVEMLNKIINERLTVRKLDEEIDKMNNVPEVNNVPETKPEEVVQIPDTAMNNIAPGFMNIDAIENNAQDIIQPERPVANMEQLLQSNTQKQEEPQSVEPTGKFFNFFDQPTPQPAQQDNFNLENFFGNMNSVPSDVAQPAPAMEAPTMPDVAQPAPAMEVPTMSDVAQPAPAMEVPTMPDVAQPAPAMEVPTMPEVTQPAPAMEVPTMPDVAQPAPAMEVPTMPEVAQPAPAMEAPTMPDVAQPAPAMEAPTMSETAQPSSPIYEVPIAESTDTIPVIDQPIEPSINVGNTNVETFTAPANNVPEQVIAPTVKAAVPNMRVALNTIRECENTLEKYGFNVDVEEIDFEDSYQVIFKIEK